MSMERRALCKRLFKASVVLSLIAFALATLLTRWGHLALPGP